MDRYSAIADPKLFLAILRSRVAKLGCAYPDGDWKLALAEAEREDRFRWIRNQNDENLPAPTRHAASLLPELAYQISR